LLSLTSRIIEMNKEKQRSLPAAKPAMQAKYHHTAIFKEEKDLSSQVEKAVADFESTIALMGLPQDDIEYHLSRAVRPDGMTDASYILMVMDQ